jgi:sec-independent protein translocase protein TatB
MLDVGFSEILLTSAIALIVLGPEKLPKVARQVGNWVGRARAMARQLTEQLEREVSAEELMKQTKSSSAKTGVPGGAPAPFDTFATQNYTPSTPQPAEASPAAAPPAANGPAAAYSPETAATVHGADWHANPADHNAPVDHKPTNE